MQTFPLEACCSFHFGVQFTVKVIARHSLCAFLVFLHASRPTNWQFAFGCGTNQFEINIAVWEIIFVLLLHLVLLFNKIDPASNDFLFERTIIALCPFVVTHYCVVVFWSIVGSFHRQCARKWVKFSNVCHSTEHVCLHARVAAV